MIFPHQEKSATVRKFLVGIGLSVSLEMLKCSTVTLTVLCIKHCDVAGLPALLPHSPCDHFGALLKFQNSQELIPLDLFFAFD